MELLDIYDAEMNPIGTEERSVVHRDALWHKTVHCWLYDSLGFVYFQQRKEEGTFYTTASGHVAAGETVKEAFGREIYEEIGISLNYEKAELIDIVHFQMDREKKDGSFFRDRAFAHVFGYLLEDTPVFHLDPEEVSGIVKVHAKETLSLFQKESGEIDAEVIDVEGNSIHRKVNFSEFLVNSHETALTKYGDVLQFVIDKTK